jgi:ferrous iron transport protein B
MVLFGLYVAGVLMAVLTAKLMRRFMFKVDETPFVMELPPYRVPTVKTTLIHMWDKCAQYLRKMGGLILVASIFIWFLSYYPKSVDSDTSQAAHYENSYLGTIGKACEPIFEPLGFNWKSSVALLSGVAAKEIVVSTLGVLYSEGEEDSGRDGEVTLRYRLAASNDFDTASAMAFLIFILIYFPCIATVMAIASELGWKWAVGSIVYSTTIAWIVAYAVYNLINLLL